MLGREPRGDERLVDAVARERVDEPGRVADEQARAAREPVARPPHRQAVPAHVVQAPSSERRARAQSRSQVLAQARPLALPAADADVRVVALREDPAVAARHGAELEDERAARSASAGALVRRRSPRARRRARCAAPSPSGARGRAVGAVGADRRPPTATRSRADAAATLSSELEPRPSTPSRNSAPAAAACSTRKASSRRRCVIRTSGASARALEASAVARAGSSKRSTRVLDHRLDGERAAAAPPAPSARRRTACRAGTAPCRRAARARPRARGGSAAVDPAGPAPTTSDVEALHPRSSAQGYNRAPQGVCPSGQRERAVNPSAQPTEVRILPAHRSMGETMFPPRAPCSLVVRTQACAAREPESRSA